MRMVIFTYENYLEYEKYLKETKETIEYFEKIAANVKQEDKLILQRIIKIIYKEKIGKEETNKLINKIMGGEKNMLAVLDMIDKEYQMYINKGKEEGIKEGKKYNIPINVDTIKEGYPILCA